MSTRTLDTKYFGRFSDVNIEIVRSKDSFLFDAKGKRYIDFFMGWCVGNFGWANPEIRKALKNSKSPEYIHPSFLYRPWVEFAELLVSMAPGKLKKCFRTTGGTESVDGALQLAMLYTKRSKFISIEGAYHGNSIGALSVGESENRKKIPSLLPNCYKVNPSFDAKALKTIETLLSKKDIAAFIMEPIICNLGVVIPDYNFMQSLQKLCHKYGTLLIMDEVATGFGRTGKIFACEHFDIQPDIMTLGKAISGGYGAIGALLTTEEIANSVKGDFILYSTYGWHPLSVDASLATLNFLKKNKRKILSNVDEMNSLFINRLQNMKFQKLKQVNAIGMAFGIVIDDLKYLKEVRANCRKNGLLLSMDDTTLMLMPALTIDLKTAKAGLDILEKSL